MDTLVKYSKKLKYKVNYYVVQKFKSYGTPKDLQKMRNRKLIYQ